MLRPIGKLDTIVLLAMLSVTVGSFLAERYLLFPVTGAYIQLLRVTIETGCIVLSMLIFSVGWLSFGTERNWAIALVSSLFLGVGLLDLGQLLSYPFMPPLFTENSPQKAATFSLFSRLLAGVALLLAACIPIAKKVGMPARYGLLAGVVSCIAEIYFVALFHSGEMPVLYSAQAATPTRHAFNTLLIGLYGGAALLFVRRLQYVSFAWVGSLLLGSATLAFAELNYRLAIAISDLGNTTGHILKFIAYVFLYRSVFQHSVRLPIEQMNAWKEKLEDSQRELTMTKVAVESSGYYIYEIDEQGSITFASTNACDRMGYPLAQLLGKPFWEITTDTQEEVSTKNRYFLQQRKVIRYEAQARTKSGEIFPVDITVTLIVDDNRKNSIYLVVHDISERKHFEAEREEQQAHLRQVIDSMPFFVTVLDAKGNIIDMNKTVINKYHVDKSAVWGKSLLNAAFRSLMDSDSEEVFRRSFDRALTGDSVRCDICVSNGLTQEYMECSFSPLRGSSGDFTNIILIGFNISERVRSQNQLKLAATAFDHSAEAFLITDGCMRVLSVNRAFTTITGFTEDDVKGNVPLLFERGSHLHSMRLALASNGDWSGEVEWKSKLGELCYEWVTVTRVSHDDGSISNYIVIFSDITDKKRVEEQVQYLAYYDPLTNLPNRVLLEDRIQQALSAAKRSDRKVAIVFLDLDYFKAINDSLGHQYGDKVLGEVAKRLKRNIREGDTVARLGGDEFIVVLPGLGNLDEAAAINRKLLCELAIPYNIGGQELRLSASIGVSIFPDDGEDFSRLIMNADAAMYHAKEHGRNNAQFFIGEMNRRAAELLTMENDLRRAIENDEFVLNFQPQIDLQSNAIVGLEALIRWKTPNGALISPAQFIPLAEERGLITQIGSWVLREACRQNRAWQEAGLPKLPIAVNVSPKQFRDKAFVEKISSVLSESGLDSRYLELEVTETLVMQDAESVILTLEALHGLGVHLAVDDFGTGYSSLSYLKRFPIDKLKIDRSFVKDIPGDRDDYSIVRAIIDLSHQLNLKVVAEGVETIEQLVALRDSGCDQYQGFYFSRPLSALDVRSFLENSNAA